MQPMRHNSKPHMWAYGRLIKTIHTFLYVSSSSFQKEALVLTIFILYFYIKTYI
jgi:hypothetical protein